MYKMAKKNFLLQTLLLPLVLLSGHEYGERRQLALTPDAPASRLTGEAIPGNSTNRTWNLIGPPDSRLHLNCTDLTLLKSADCSLSIFENGEEEKICKGESTVYSRQSEGNRLTVRIKTEPSTRGGRVSCDISLMKGSPLTDSEDYMDDNVQHEPKTPDPYGANKKKRIIGGVETEDHAFPFMAAIMLRDLRNQLKMHCGGTIRTVRHIITAAHCLDYDQAALLVVVGTNNINDFSAVQTRSVIQMIPHEYYRKEGFKYDIGILILSHAIQFGPSVQPVNFPAERINFPFNIVAALGWGETVARGYPVSPAMLSVSLTVTGLVECFNRYGPGNVSLDYPTQICVKTVRSDTCKKDSGGPLLVLNVHNFQFVQVGLITEKTPCKVNDVVPRLHTDIFPYVNWINQKTNQIPPETSDPPGPSHASGPSGGSNKRQKTMRGRGRGRGRTAAEHSSRGNI